MPAKMVIVQLLCRCPQCGKENKVVADYNQPNRYHKCIGCNELIPLGGYNVIAISNDLSRPIF
uniref:Uncharacterized protein n=1 Tax=viral metagenome TaxID=1070528 RepID=A0A6M3Y1N3_9ZZZZ